MPLRRLLTHLETWFLVTLISVLVWLYAEGAMVQSYPRQRIAIDLVPPPGARLAIEPERATALVSFRGSAAQLQELKARLAQGAVEVPVRPGGERVQEVELTERLEQLLFVPLGLVVDEVEPERLEVEARRIVTREVPIAIDTGGLRLREPATASPSTARISVPEDRLNLLERLRPTASLGPEAAEAAGTAGEPQVLTLPLRVPDGLAGPFTSLETDTADVSFTLATPEATATLDAVPLWQLTPLNFAFEAAVVGGEKVLRDVVLVGPGSTLERIRAGDPAVPVWAEVRLTDAAGLTEGRRLLPVTVRTPEGLGVTAPGLRSVEVELIRKR